MDVLNFMATFLRSQLLTSLPHPKFGFSDQVVIVTGSNTGLGLEAARHLLRLNAAKVILAVRTISKGETAAASIVKSTGVDPSRVEVWPLDLSSYESVKTFGNRVRRLKRLDAVIQNAGITTGVWKEMEGNESQITVNLVSPVLLGLLVLPKLRESAKAFDATGRLVFVGSDLQYIAKLKEQHVAGSLFDALNDKEHVDMSDRYNVSKLLLLYAVRSLAQSSPVTPESNVIINYVTPGACKSDIFRDDVGWIEALPMTVAMALVARTAEVGSRTYLHAAKPDIGVDTHGAFLMDCKVAPNGPNVESRQGIKVQERFTGELFERLERIQPGVTKVSYCFLLSSPE